MGELADIWLQDRAVLELLWKLRRGFQSPAQAAQDLSYFDDILECKVHELLRELLAEGVFVPPSPIDILGFYNVTGLKGLLKQSGLKVSGKRNELEARLLGSAKEMLSELARRSDRFVLSNRAQAAVLAYREECKYQRRKAEEFSLRALLDGNFEKAARIVVEFEKCQVLKRGIGINWSSHLVSGMTERASQIFEVKPAILDKVLPPTLEYLRAAAAMMELWGTGVREMKRWIPKGLETGLAIDDTSAAHMIYNSALHTRRMKKYREDDSGVVGVQIVAIMDAVACELCRWHDGRMYLLDDVPELPHSCCTSEAGCRCTVVPVLDWTWEDLMAGDKALEKRWFGYLKGESAPRTMKEALS